MKKNLQKIVAVALFTTVPLVAGGYANTTESLFALEGGYSDLKASVDQPGYNIQDSKMGHFGLKLGAQGEHYRVFLSGRYYDSDAGNTILTAGAEVQYKFNFSEPVDFFLGANTGIAQIKIGTSDDGLLASISERVPYIGADAGFNYHASKLVDLEVGVKYMNMDETITQGTVTYDFSSIASVYTSVIIKWQMD